MGYEVVRERRKSCSCVEKDMEHDFWSSSRETHIDRCPQHQAQEMERWKLKEEKRREADQKAKEICRAEEEDRRQKAEKRENKLKKLKEELKRIASSESSDCESPAQMCKIVPSANDWKWALKRTPFDIKQILNITNIKKKMAMQRKSNFILYG